MIKSVFFFGLFITVFLAMIPVQKSKAMPLFEFRGVWVATAHNIDWPSRPGLDVNAMKEGARAILNLQQSLGMNVVILQVRPAGDAFFYSEIEPWSRFLTGQQGLAPPANFDPLQFWIEEAHSRQMALHAWINPFRAATRGNAPLHESHPAVVNPDWVIKHSNQLYYNPGLPAVREHIRRVVADLVTRYDIDGLHIDDYFYPYPVSGEVFDDSHSFAQYGLPNGFERVQDWRRHNINTVVEDIYTTIKEIKPWVKFGISPFGVWRNRANDPRGSDTRAGVTCYDDLHADVLYWYEQGWFDYIVPQVYWSTICTAANFNVVTQWWNNEIRQRHLYIGHGIYKINDQVNWDNPMEVPIQISNIRALDNILGSVFFSHRHFNRENNNLNYKLANDLYRLPALTPPMPWLDNTPPEPVSSIGFSNGILYWQAIDTSEEMNQQSRYLVYYYPVKGNQPRWIITRNPFISAEELTTSRKQRYNVRVFVLDRLNNISPVSPSIRVRL